MNSKSTDFYKEIVSCAMRQFIFLLITYLSFSCTNNPTQYEYADGSGNRYILTPTSLSYIPVKPGESSSGTYSGGEPKEILLKDGQFNSIRTLLDNAINNTSIHIQDRVKMSGAISIVYKKERKQYILRPGSEELKAIEELHKVQKISLNAGESKQVTFTLDQNDLAFVNSVLKSVTEPGDFEVMIGDKKATFTFK